MISLAQPLPVGNAVRLFLTPSTGEQYSRLLRRTSNEFTGPDDSGAVWVADGCRDNVVLDTRALVNNQPYFYQLYSWSGSGWSAAGAPVSVTPATSYEPGGPDPQFIVRERLELGLAAEVAAGRLKPDGGKVTVLTAPFVLADNANFPMVTVHMDSCQPSTRFVGDIMAPDMEFSSGVSEDAGWLANWSITVLGASLNSDERIAMREAIRRVIQANMPVWADAGMLEVGFAQRDVEDTQQYAAPMYMTYGTFTCIAPSFLRDYAEPIHEIDLAVGLFAPVFTTDDGVIGQPPADQSAPDLQPYDEWMVSEYV